MFLNFEEVEWTVYLKKKKTYLIKFEILYFFTNRYKNKNFLIFCKYARIFENLFVDPAFLAIMRFPLKRRYSFFYLKQKKTFLENGLESPLIFVFILKGKTK